MEELEEKTKYARMYMLFYENGKFGNTPEKLYYGFGFHTLDEEYASYFDYDDEFEVKKLEELKEKGWKVEVYYK